MPRDPKLTPSLLVGNAGEFFVLAELTRRGWTAALTARNNHAFDILAAKADVSIRIRVKTKTTLSDVFQWSAKKTGDIFLDLGDSGDFSVLVDVPLDGNPPEYFVVPTRQINQWLQEDFKEWVTTPGAKGQQRDADNTRRLFYVDDKVGKLARGYKIKLEPYRNNWDSLSNPRRIKARSAGI